MNAEVVIYTTGWCSYCQRARALLRAKGIGFREIDVEEEAQLRQEMIQRSGRRSVPQIFIGERHVGGFEELAQLEHAGELDPLLKQEPT